MPLRIPSVLAFTVVGAAVGCGDGKPTTDASTCEVYCIPQAPGANHCPPPTCATGTRHDVCPSGCIPEPIA